MVRSQVPLQCPNGHFDGKLTLQNGRICRGCENTATEDSAIDRMAEVGRNHLDLVFKAPRPENRHGGLGHRATANKVSRVGHRRGSRPHNETPITWHDPPPVPARDRHGPDLLAMERIAKFCG